MTTLDAALKRRGIDTNGSTGPIEVDRVVKVGDVDSGNYSEFDEDGSLTFKGDGTVFNDVQFSITTAKVPAANAPTWSAFVGNLNKFTFAINDYVDLEAQEIPHGTMEESDKEWHVHIFTNGLEAVDKVVNYQIEYCITAEDGVPSVVTVSGDFTIPANTPDKTKLYIMAGVVDGTGQTFGEDISCQLKRIAAVAGADPTADPFVSMVGLHIEQDKVGSKNITSNS